MIRLTKRERVDKAARALNVMVDWSHWQYRGSKDKRVVLTPPKGMLFCAGGETRTMDRALAVLEAGLMQDPATVPDFKSFSDHKVKLPGYLRNRLEELAALPVYDKYTNANEKRPARKNFLNLFAMYAIRQHFTQEEINAAVASVEFEDWEPYKTR